MASRLGADVPFFLSGGTARARGIGERLSEIDCRMDWRYLLFKEGSKPSTKEMYDRLDGTDYPKPDIDAVENALREGNAEEFFAVTDNSFSALWPETETESLLTKLGARCVLLSGSGPTRFAVFPDAGSAGNACEKLKEIGIGCTVTNPVA